MKKSKRKSILYLSAGTLLFAAVGVILSCVLSNPKAKDSPPKVITRTRTCTYKNLTFFQESEASAGLAFTLEKKPFTQNQLTKIKDTLNSEKIRTLSDEMLEYDCGNYFEGDVQLTEAEAISYAKKYLDNLGLLPKDNYMIDTSFVGCSTIDPFNGTASSNGVVSRTILFYQTYHEVPVVSDDDNFISVVLGAKGVTYLKYHWPNVIPAAPAASESRTILTADEAMQKYFDSSYYKHQLYDRDNTNIYFRQVYGYRDNQSVSTWVFGTDSEAFCNSVYLDAYTGKELQVWD